MDSALLYLIGLIAVALAFDFLNGLHDAANSIATIVSTRVLRPQYAVFWAAFFNFIAFLFFGLHVAQTVGTGIITPDVIDDYVIFGALMGAISWNLLTWALGIPSSSSHALIGGLVGAGFAKAGIGAVVWSGVIKTGSAVVFSPALGFVLALFLVLAVSWIFVRRTPLAVDNIFRIPPIRLRLVLFPRPRRQRRAEDDGNHHRATPFARQARRRISRPLLGRVELSDGDGARHTCRRLADRPHHGLENYQTDPDAGLLR